MKRRAVVPVVALLGCTPVFAATSSGEAGRTGADEVRLERHGDDLIVDAHADLAVSRDIAWDVLTDYDHLARFIPDMTKSQAIDRHDPIVHVRQEGHTGFPPLRREFWLLFEVRETPRIRIDMIRTEGTFTRFEASYVIHDLPRGGVRIVYHASFDPAMPVPDWLGLGYVRSTVREHFEAVMHEMQRRARETRP